MWTRRRAGLPNDLFSRGSDRLEEITKLIGRHTRHWKMDQRSSADRDVLGAAVAEFLGYPETPQRGGSMKRWKLHEDFRRRSRLSSLTACWIAWGKRLAAENLSKDTP